MQLTCRDWATAPAPTKLRINMEGRMGSSACLGELQFRSLNTLSESLSTIASCQSR